MPKIRLNPRRIVGLATGRTAGWGGIRSGNIAYRSPQKGEFILRFSLNAFIVGGATRRRQRKNRLPLAILTIEANRLMHSTYKGPIEIVTLTAGAYSIRLARPALPDSLLDEPEVLARNKLDDAMPYWAFVWPSAFLLAEAVARRGPPAPGDPALLEIGCGLGIAGVFALQHGYRVVFSDEDREALAFAARSAAENGHAPARYQTLRIDWREPAPRRFGLVIGSDILYEKKLAPTLACFLESTLADHGVALVADPGRASASTFPEELARVGLACATESLSVETSEFDLVRGSIYSVSRPEARRTKA